MNIDLDALQALAEQATPGPWGAYDANEGEYPPRPLWSVANDAFHNPTGEDLAAIDLSIWHSYCGKPDAEFIAAAREAVPALIARIREMEGENLRLKQDLEECETSRLALLQNNESIIARAISLERELERRADTGKSAVAAKWTDGLPDNLPAAALDALLWLQYTQARSKLLGMSAKDWGRLDDCIEALHGFLPQPISGRATEGGEEGGE